LGRWSWSLLCLLLPVSGAWITIPLVVAVAALLLSRIGRPFAVDRELLWPLGLFYLLHAIGMAWSTDVDFGLFDLQIKLGLVLLPLAAAALLAERTEALRESMTAFAIGCVLAVGLSLAKAFECHAENGWIECFTQSYLSFDLHPSYAAWYTVWALLFWGHALITGKVPARWRWAVVLFLMVALVFAVMLASKSGLLCLAVVAAFLVALAVRRLKGALRWKVLLGMAVLLAVPAFVLAPVIAMRIGSAVEQTRGMLDGSTDIYTSDNGNAERLVAWACSARLIRRDPIGAGTGDIKHALVECYESRGATAAARLRLNSHSQFLQGGVALGWAGLVAALLVALVPLVQAVRRRQALVAMFMLLFTFNAAIESVLEVQAGVVFFGLFLGLFAVGPRPSHA